MLVFRDRAILNLTFRDVIPTTGPISGVVVTGAGTYFSDAVDVGTYIEAMGYLNVTANDGGSTLDVKFQTSPDKLHWTDLSDAFTQVSTTNSQTIKRLTANFGRYIRAIIVLTGANAAYTFSLVVAVKG